MSYDPLMTAEEVVCYKRHLANSSAVLEYGVGGSTVLAAEQGVGFLYSVDSDPTWLAKISNQPAVARMIAAGRAKLVHVDIGPLGNWGKPKSRWSMIRWPAYARHPWQDGFVPDLVLVDGRFRLSCIMHALCYGRSDTRIAVHDFVSYRVNRFRSVLEFASIIDVADSLVN